MTTKLLKSAFVGAGLVLAVGLAQPSFAGGSGANFSGGEPPGQSGGKSCTCSECLWVDTYNPNNPSDHVTDKEFTTGVLQSGVLYEVEISGTASYWAPDMWIAPEGTPGSAPMFPSLAGDMTGPVGIDWEYLYSYPDQTFTLSLPYHYQYGLVSLDGGLTFVDIVPAGGQTYQGSHVYQYVVVGQGQKAAFERIDQGPSFDNYGRFKVCVYRLSACGKKDDNGGGDDGNPGGHS
jgi:hypothetical protein